MNTLSNSKPVPSKPVGGLPPKRWASALLTGLLLTGLLSASALAVDDNYVDRQLYQPGGTSSVTKHSTNSAGVHTDHVIVDSGSVATSRSATGATAQVALSTSASVAAAANSARHSLLVRNADATISVYIGFTSGVTSSTGFILKAGESTTIYCTAAIYAVAASGTPSIHTLAEND